MPTTNVGAHLLEKGNYKKAREELLRVTGRGSTELSVMLAICDVRLGELDSIQRLRALQRGFSSEQSELLLRHEVLGHLEHRDVTGALNAIHASPAGLRTRSALRDLKQALESVQQAQRAFTRGQKAQAAATAQTGCAVAVESVHTADDYASAWARVVAEYLMLYAELLRSKNDMRLVYEIRSRLTAAGDVQFVKTLPRTSEAAKRARLR